MSTQLDRILRAARLDETRNGNSAYFDIGRFAIRVSDHARQSHHRGCTDFSAPDIHALILSESVAEDFAAWRSEAPREVMAAVVIIRKTRERATTTARKLRDAIASMIFARLKKAQSVKVGDGGRAVAAEWAREREQCSEWIAQVPEKNTAGRKNVVVALRRQAIARGVLAEVAARHIG